jgi:hypothetical protein
MPYELSDAARETTLRVARAAFPHAALPDECYVAVVDGVQADAGNDEAVQAQVEEGLEAFESGGFTDLDADAQLEFLRRHEDLDYFKLVRATAVVALYDNPVVWKAFGYEGPSAHLGGYVNRGFNDLDWLPDPPIELDSTAGSHHG